MTGTLEDADDLAQETFICAFERIGSFRGDAQFSSWLYRIAINRCLNWRKEKERRDRLHRDWSNEDIGETSSGQIGRAELIQDALLRLPEKQRAAVILTTYEGLNHAEAAKALGCSEPTVSWRVFAARRKLKRLLKRLLKDERK
jgi:RNA polymerase sigma-70 factor (ECF subfamily)